MSRFVIKGGNKLKGSIRVSGNKNSALKLIAASLLSDSTTKLNNVPVIVDVSIMAEIVNELGCNVRGIGTNRLTINPKNINTHIIGKELSGRIRTAPLLIAPLLLRFGKVQITTKGGCSLGYRLLATHFSLLEDMGAKIRKNNGGYLINFKPTRKKRDIFLEEASVTATELGLILAAGIPSETIISDAACEPHVEDLAEMLIKMGASIKGAGTNTIRINGKRKLKGVDYTVAPDHIEAGSWAILAACTGSNLTIENIKKEDLRMICTYFDHLGVKYSFPSRNTWKITSSKLKFDNKVKEFQTRPWPGLPTDLMSPFIVLCTQADGQTVCHDWMFEWRMFFVEDLISMGAKIIIADPHRVIIRGPSKLNSDKMVCKNIRAGIALVIAALAAKGISEIDKVEIIERGYEKLFEKLIKVGADVVKLD